MAVNLDVLKQQIQKAIDDFNKKMEQEGKPISLELHGNSIVFRYRNALDDLFKKIKESGINAEIIVAGNSIMIKITIDDLKKAIIEKSGIPELQNANLRIEEKDIVGEIKL
jgi:hypothetical protein|uniref:Uncharacterized protein n=1 Tax=Candidatus Aramenus sulfurataquae TaxID=1326980 RepID=A0A0F2LQG2_9CREN|nr:hypothetical protein [Candidatus Aramenus sulfurataquae]